MSENPSRRDRARLSYHPVDGSIAMIGDRVRSQLDIQTPRNGNLLASHVSWSPTPSASWRVALPARACGSRKSFLDSPRPRLDMLRLRRATALDRIFGPFLVSSHHDAPPSGASTRVSVSTMN